MTWKDLFKRRPVKKGPPLHGYRKIKHLLEHLLDALANTRPAMSSPYHEIPYDSLSASFDISDQEVTFRDLREAQRILYEAISACDPGNRFDVIIQTTINGAVAHSLCSDEPRPAHPNDLPTVDSAIDKFELTIKSRKRLEDPGYNALENIPNSIGGIKMRALGLCKEALEAQNETRRDRADKLL